MSKFRDFFKKLSFNPFKKPDPLDELSQRQRASVEAAVKAVQSKMVEKLTGKEPEKEYLSIIHEGVAELEVIRDAGLANNRRIMEHWAKSRDLAHKLPGVAQYHHSKWSKRAYMEMIANLLRKRAPSSNALPETLIDTDSESGNNADQDVPAFLRDKVMFLEHVRDHSFMSYTQHYKALQLSFRDGAAMRKILEEEGLIDCKARERDEQEMIDRANEGKPFMTDSGMQMLDQPTVSDRTEKRLPGRPPMYPFLTDKGHEFLRLFGRETKNSD